MTQHFVELVQALIFGQRLILKELGLPAVEATQTPGGGGDLLDGIESKREGSGS